MGRKAQAVPLKLGTLCSQVYLSGCLGKQEAKRSAWTIFLQCQMYSMVSNLKTFYFYKQDRQDKMQIFTDFKNKNEVSK